MSLILSGTEGLSDVDGSAATPAIRGTDANTGIFFGADTIGFSEGGVEAARINSSGQFDLVNNPVLTGGTANGVAYLNGSKVLTTGSALVFDGTNLGVGVTPSAWASFKSMDVNDGGAGLTSSGQNCYLTTNAYYNSGWKYKFTTVYGVSWYEQFNGQHAWFSAPSGTAGNAISATQAMTLNASGSLGITETSPTAKLHISVASAVVDGTKGVKITNPGGTAVMFECGVSGDSFIGTTSGSDFNIRTGNTVRATFDTAGNLLVGTTATSAGARLYVKGSGSSNAAARFYNPDLTDSNYTLYVDKPSATTTTSQVFIGFTVNAQGTGSGQINANGASQAAFGSFSDARLKENIVDLTPQLSNLMALRPVEFDYKDGSGHQTGFVAQEMQQIYPDAIGEQNGFLTVSGYGKTEARLIKAIQEQQAIITTLTARITALESA